MGFLGFILSLVDQIIFQVKCHFNFNNDNACYYLCIWFVRCREKQRRESSRLQAVNRKLTAMNKLLMEENDRLQKQVSQLAYENGYFRQHTQNVRIYAFGFSVVTSSCGSLQFNIVEIEKEIWKFNCLLIQLIAISFPQISN